MKLSASSIIKAHDMKTENMWCINRIVFVTDGCVSCLHNYHLPICNLNGKWFLKLKKILNKINKERHKPTVCYQYNDARTLFIGEICFLRPSLFTWMKHIVFIQGLTASTANVCSVPILRLSV